LALLAINRLVRKSARGKNSYLRGVCDEEEIVSVLPPGFVRVNKVQLLRFGLKLLALFLETAPEKMSNISDAIFAYFSYGPYRQLAVALQRICDQYYKHVMIVNDISGMRHNLLS